MSVKKIDQKIVAYRVKPKEEEAPPLAPVKTALEKVNECMKRPETLRGITYKLKAPNFENAFYITINDILLNRGTKNEEYQPFELFINSKNMEPFEWVVGLTRMISSNFRKGGNLEYIVEELSQVHSPSGGFWDRGKYYPSLVARIGAVIDTHLKSLGIIKVEDLTKEVKETIEKKLEAFTELHGSEGAKNKMLLCAKCGEKTVILMDGCLCCTSCGDSKCG